MKAVAIYTVANIENVCGGHGDYRNLERIRRTGPWESGGFPPCFVSRAGAEAYMEATKGEHGERHVVELTLMLPEERP